LFLLLLRRNQADELAIPEEAMLERFAEWTRSLQSKGILRAVERLKGSSGGFTVRARADVINIEGPYTDAKEDVVGIYLIEVADHSNAQTIAKECPILLVGGSVEIRETDSFPKP
jgi:hypothetical protein